MLPFLKQRKDNTGLAIKYRKPDEDQSDSDSSDIDPALTACAQDIMRAIEQGDIKHLALAIQSAFQICDAMPHEEGEHLNDESEDE